MMVHTTTETAPEDPMPGITDYRTVTLDGFTFYTTKLGFPIEECSRCGATGYFGPRSVDGGRCFDCGGNAVVNSRGTSGDIAAEYRNDLRRSRNAIVRTMKPGDVILYGDEWKTVAHTQITDKTCGSSLIGTDESKRTYSYYYLVTFEGDEPVELSDSLLYKRRGSVDAAPYVARSQAAHVAKLRGRGDKPNAEAFAAARKADEERAAAKAAAQAKAKEEADMKARREATDLATEAVKKLADAANLMKGRDQAAYEALIAAIEAAVTGATASHRKGCREGC
jgi:hypothetical protein